MNFLPIFIVAMPDSKRVELIKSQLERLGLSFVIQKSIVGNNLTEEEIKEKVNLRGCDARLGYKISKSLIGSGLSHIEVYKKALALESEWVLILEEDVIMIDFDRKLITRTLSEVGNSPAIIQLFSRASRLAIKSSICEIETEKFVFKFNKRIAGCGAPAYLINKSALKIALDSSKLNGTPDWPSWGQKVSFFGLYPWLFKETGADTTVPENSILPRQNFWRRVSQISGVHYLVYRNEYQSFSSYLSEEIYPYLLFLIWRLRGSKYFKNDIDGIQLI
jgi:GR25 family glycosyltransferase involved in LPS biosynthesis